MEKNCDSNFQLGFKVFRIVIKVNCLMPEKLLSHYSLEDDKFTKMAFFSFNAVANTHKVKFSGS